MAKTRHFVSEGIIKNIYYALINSYLRYGLIAWGTASFETLQPIRVLVNRAIRIMSFAPFGRLDTEPIYKHFNILNVDDTFLLETGKLIYKFKKSLIPSDIINSLYISSFLSINEKKIILLSQRKFFKRFHR